MKWTRQHEQGRERIIEAMARKARPFEDLSDEAKSERRSRGLLEWCETYLPHYFDRPFAPFHRRMIEAVGEPGMPTFIGAFRGAGKSVLLSLARPLWRTLRKECPFFIYGSEVQKLAAQNMDYVRLELEHNERIRCDYGEIKISGPEEVWVARFADRVGSGRRFRFSSVKFEAFGIGMSPRGRRHGAHRPLEFVGDDLENAMLARNPQREKQLWDWLNDEVVPGLEPDVWAFTVVGTMFGPGCMLERARLKAGESDPQGRPLAKLFLQAAMEEGRSVWPERFSDAGLARIRSMLGMRLWMRNFTMQAEDPDKAFQPHWFERSYDEADIDTGKLYIVAFLDPALSESARGCPRAIVVVGCDRKSGIRYVLDAWIDRGSPDVMVAKIFELNERFRPLIFGIESNGGFALIRPLLAAKQGGHDYVPARYIPATEAKEIRIERLAAAIEDGRWQFPKNPNQHVRTLIDQFINYPDGFIDGPDACAGCDALLPPAWNPQAAAFEYRRGPRRPWARQTPAREFAHI